MYVDRKSEKKLKGKRNYISFLTLVITEVFTSTVDNATKCPCIHTYYSGDTYQHFTLICRI